MRRTVQRNGQPHHPVRHSRKALLRRHGVTTSNGLRVSNGGGAAAEASLGGKDEVLRQYRDSDSKKLEYDKLGMHVGLQWAGRLSRRGPPGGGVGAGHALQSTSSPSPSPG